VTALDAMVMIWGLKSQGAKVGNPKQRDLREMRYRARVLLDMLEGEQQAVMFPTIALAEVLVGVDEKMHSQFIDTIQKTFYCPPFTLPASALAAKLWQANHRRPEGERMSRTTIKADVLIIATAAVHGAKRFYSHDKKARTIAELAGMQALDLPLRHHDMHVDAELRKEFGLDNDVDDAKE
jgi:predicted nucleic acid-binding protein